MHETPLPDMLLLLAAAVVVVALFRSFRLSPVLGYLMAGTLIGPHGFAMVHAVQTTTAIAELGVVLLLFMIGLELSLDRLIAMRRKVFGIGGMQVLVTTTIIGGCAWFMGISGTGALIIGAGLALSSTALVLQVLYERKELASQTGRLSLAVLILQDLTVLPLLALVPIVAQNNASLLESLGAATVQAGLVLVLIVVLGRLALRPLFRFIAQLDINELFVATTLLVVLGISSATNAAGLSMALGAFIAGLLLAETEFQHQIEADVKPYKGLLMGLFFMCIGMAIDLEFIANNIVLVLASAAALIGLKTAVTYGTLRVFSYPKRTAIHTALLLSQGGEFGFILFGMAAATGIMTQEISQLLLLVITMTMALTPMLERLGNLFERTWTTKRRDDPSTVALETVDMGGHIVIAGYGDTGEMLAGALERESLPFIAVDTDPRRVLAGKRQKHPVYFGDATRPDVLEAVGATRASAIILTFIDEEASAHALALLHTHYPQTPIFARGDDIAAKLRLESLGAAASTAERDSTGMTLLAFTLTALSWPEEEVARVMGKLRAPKRSAN